MIDNPSKLKQQAVDSLTLAHAHMPTAWLCISLLDDVPEEITALADKAVLAVTELKVYIDEHPDVLNRDTGADAQEGNTNGEHS